MRPSRVRGHHHVSILRRTCPVANHIAREASLVIDLIYVLTTVLFFALMLAYVAACNRLGRNADVERATREQP